MPAQTKRLRTSSSNAQFAQWRFELVVEDYQCAGFCCAPFLHCAHEFRAGFVHVAWAVECCVIWDEGFERVEEEVACAVSGFVVGGFVA